MYGKLLELPARCLLCGFQTPNCNINSYLNFQLVSLPYRFDVCQLPQVCEPIKKISLSQFHWLGFYKKDMTNTSL